MRPMVVRARESFNMVATSQISGENMGTQEAGPLALPYEDWVYEQKLNEEESD